MKKENNENKVVFDSKSFIGFYVGQHTYTIECYDANNILVRTVDNQDRAWYLWLTDKEVSTTPSKDVFTDLVWSDDFNYNGKLNPFVIGFHLTYYYTIRLIIQKDQKIQ